MGIKTGPKFQITHDTMWQLIVMSEFWALLPATCVGIKDEWLETQTKKCSGCTSQRSIAGFHSKIWNRIAVSIAMEQEPDTLTKLADLITAKRGYRPTPIEVYYKDETGHLIKLSF